MTRKGKKIQSIIICRYA